MTAGEFVGHVDGGVARVAEEGVVRRTVPAGPPFQAAFAGSRRLSGESAACSFGGFGGALHDVVFFPFPFLQIMIVSLKGEEEGIFS